MKQRYNNLSIFQYILLIRRTRLWSRKWINKLPIDQAKKDKKTIFARISLYFS